MLRQGLRVAVMLAATLLPACASLTVVDTTPLPQSKLEPPGSETISAGGYRIDSVTRVRGKRSAAYSHGALKGMGQVIIPGDGRCYPNWMGSPAFPEAVSPPPIMACTATRCSVST